MREILFRGKRIDNGEWLEGYYAKSVDSFACKERNFIQTQELNVNGGKNFLGNTSLAWFEVDPATVGQYTGMTDKNGKKIFEGDMIKPFEDEIDKMVVEFHHGQFLLCLYGERGYMTEYGWEPEGNYGCFEAEPLSSYGDDIEVIGNIHDNPELLKQEEE